MKISSLKIGSRLGITFSLVLVLLSAIAILSIINMAAMNTETKTLVNSDFVKMRLAYEALDNARASMARVSGIVAATEGKADNTARTRLVATIGKVDTALGKLEPMLASTEARDLYGKIKTSRDQYVASYERVLALIGNDQRAAASTLAYSETYTALLAFVANLRSFSDYQQALFAASAEKNEHDYQGASMQVIILSLLALTAGVAAAVWITRSITVPVNHAVRIAQTIAAGDLTQHFSTTHEDETAHLINALQDMNDNLSKIVEQVRSGTEIIMDASKEIAQGNLDLSARTEAQAGSLEETAATMEQLTNAVRHNADNARQANTLAHQSSDIAVQGGAAVELVVSTMAEINAASKKIVDIISVIDGIAFQTNILALNAAVEAARAGEQGRGFAVVASEVRSLAQRSALAAKEIKELISTTVQRVENGSVQASQAGATMANVVSSIKQVTDMMGEITSATQEQSQGIDQINQGIIEMDNVTQQNAALVEQASAAAMSMQEQSQALMATVNIFHLGHASPASSNNSVRDSQVRLLR